jgi:hypothetical protein
MRWKSDVIGFACVSGVVALCSLTSRFQYDWVCRHFLGGDQAAYAWSLLPQLLHQVAVEPWVIAGTTLGSCFEDCW